MNKYEKLIEYIINDNEQKARELFHEIVVEKSRDIYESLMDEEQVEENFGGDQAEELVDEVTADETGGLAEEGDEEFSLGDEPSDDGIGGDLGDDAGSDDEMGFGDDAGDASIDELSAKIDDIADKIDSLIAGDDGEESEFDAGDDAEEAPAEIGAGSDEEGSGEEDEGSDEEMFAEGENPFAKGSGKSGSGASGSGKSGSGKSGSGKSGSGVAESKSVAQLMREYVDKIGEVYGGEGDSSEGAEVGNGKKVNVNSKSIARNEDPGFGGTNKNIARGGAEQSPDGKQTPKPNNEYSKGETKMSNEKFQNVAGGSKKQSAVGKNWESDKGAEGQTTSGKVPVSDKTVLKQNTGK